jgi:Secretion system C-terminal sorting domain
VVEAPYAQMRIPLQESGTPIHTFNLFMKNILLLFSFIVFQDLALGQGYNHTWLIGSENSFDTFTTSPKARLLFYLDSVSVLGEQRKMAFRATQATISDANGNFLFASNGCWIMDASGDTMQNGGGLNPGTFANGYCSNVSGLPMSGANIIIPFPGDSNKFVLFHQVGNSVNYLNSTEVFYTVVDMTLNSGLGGVIPGKKNVVAFTGNISWGLAACKHANGKDWWVIAHEDSSNIIHKVLFTSNEVANVSSQQVNMPAPGYGIAGQPGFSPDGNKYAYKHGLTVNPGFHDIRILSFDRCSGNFDSLGYAIRNNEFGFGQAFSSNSRYLYYSSGATIYQLDTDAPNISATDSIVAVYDGYCYPYPSLCTTFWLMYLAADSKIYITSPSFVIDYSFINSPDSAGISCDVQQHALRLPCYTIRGGINHPNYYLGCDTIGGCICLTGIDENEGHDFKFSISPNPASGQIRVIYLLPQNKNGKLEVFDITGRKVYAVTLPLWSTLQIMDLSFLKNGIYNILITSDNFTSTSKLVLTKP